LVLHAAAAARSRRQAGMAANPCLDAGLLVGADDVVAQSQAFAPPVALVEVEYRGRLLEEIWCAGKDPVFILPGLDGILIEDAANGPAADRPAQFGRGESGEVAEGLAADGTFALGDALTGQGGDLGAVQWGKRWAYALGPPDLRGRI